MKLINTSTIEFSDAGISTAVDAIVDAITALRKTAKLQPHDEKFAAEIDQLVRIHNRIAQEWGVGEEDSD